jgi:archaellin
VSAGGLTTLIVLITLIDVAAFVVMVVIGSGGTRSKAPWAIAR